MTKKDLKDLINECIDARENIINENNRTDYSSLLNNLGILYGHLLKYQYINHKVSSWKRTIFEQIKQLSKYSKVTWNMLDTDGVERSKTQGMDIFIKDNPRYSGIVNYDSIDAHFGNDIKNLINIDLINSFLEKYKEI